MERTADGLRKAIDLIRSLRGDCQSNVKVLDTAKSLNQSLEKAGRVADFFEFGWLMCIDALHRRRSCGGHFRAASQTEGRGAARRRLTPTSLRGNGAAGDGKPILYKEDLVYEFVELKQRSYK